MIIYLIYFFSNLKQCSFFIHTEIPLALSTDARSEQNWILAS